MCWLLTVPGTSALCVLFLCSACEILSFLASLCLILKTALLSSGASIVLPRVMLHAADTGFAVCDALHVGIRDNYK